MFPQEIANYSRALLIGVGGGNDIVSTLIPAENLVKQGVEVDVAGILSPASIHRFGDKKEKVVNRIQGDVSRYIPSPDKILISFIDGMLPRIHEEHPIGVGNFYDFSIRFGSEALVDGINSLVEINDYDLVLAIDVGGDILAREQDKTVLSPLMDHAMLRTLPKINCKTLLLEFGLGTDGELTLDSRNEILSELQENGYIYHKEFLTQQDFDTFAKYFEQIKEVRAGHTAVITQEAIRRGEDFTTPYRITTRLGKRKWKSWHDVHLDENTRKAYLLDGVNISEDRGYKPFENSLEQVVQIKQKQPEWKTELDLLYLWSSDNWQGTEGKSLQLLTPSTTLERREEMIEHGLDIMNTDYVLLLKDDAPTGFRRADTEYFSVISKNNDPSMVAEQVAKYEQERA